MTDKLIEDKEYLKTVLKEPKWWKSGDTILTVGRILDYWSMFDSIDIALDYVEKPWKFENDMRFIIEEM